LFTNRIGGERKGPGGSKLVWRSFKSKRQFEKGKWEFGNKWGVFKKLRVGLSLDLVRNHAEAPTREVNEEGVLEGEGGESADRIVRKSVIGVTLRQVRRKGFNRG